MAPYPANWPRGRMSEAPAGEGGAVVKGTGSGCGPGPAAPRKGVPSTQLVAPAPLVDTFPPHSAKVTPSTCFCWAV